MTNSKDEYLKSIDYLYPPVQKADLIKQTHDANRLGSNLHTAQGWNGSLKALAWNVLYEQSRPVVENSKNITEFPHIQEAIDKSRFILDLEDDWDEEGSIGYTEETWNKAVNLVCNMAKRYFTDYNNQAPAPSIGIGPEGSIDIAWRHLTKHILINVDASDDLVTYSGGNGSNNLISGSFNLSEVGVWLLVWLMI